MSSSYTTTLTIEDYEQAALEYEKNLPLEHFMEGTPQATQREITLESLALLKGRRADVRYFNELLVQYLFEGRLRQVVPDNMVLRSAEPTLARTSYAVELEPVPPLLVFEYVSPSSKRKDYEDSFRKYECELKVPYCLLFQPEDQDLRIYRHDGKRYIRMEPDTDGRYLIAELDLQLGLVDGWVRFWHQGRFLELPAQLLERHERQAEQLRTQAEQIRTERKARQSLEKRTADAEAARQQEVAARQRAEVEVERFRRELEALRQRPPDHP